MKKTTLCTLISCVVLSIAAFAVVKKGAGSKKPTESVVKKRTVKAVEPASRLRLLSAAPRQWERSEFQLSGVPLNGANPYDPTQIMVDATIISPSRVTLKVPLFWYVGYSRSLESDEKGDQVEKVVADSQSPGQWRLRWTPLEQGEHILSISIKRGSQNKNLLTMTWRAAARLSGAHGFTTIEPTQKRFFQTGDGKPMPLIGINACWPGKRGTYDYDDWLSAMGRNSMNYTRLWQGNAGFRTELYADERQNYSQPTMWQLDHVFDVAEQNGINIMLAMGFHGEFQTELDAWGHSGWWVTHAYQTKNGGPCEKPNDFFTNPVAARLYKNRLRYLVARYGANTNLLSWQFFNEISNIYGDEKASRSTNREQNRLHPSDVVSWHKQMGTHLRSIDGYNHLVTTSFGSAGDQSSMWKLPELDYTNWHWYTNWGGPYTSVTEMTDAVGSQWGNRYNKPVIIAEFGTDGRSWSPENDAERRGLRQSIWGGIYSGTAGTSMSWWWESIHEENLYPLWKSLRDFLPEEFGNARWKNIASYRPDRRQTDTLLEFKSAANRFSQKFALTTKWAKGSGAPIFINQPGDGEDSLASGYIHGQSKSELRTPFVIKANLGEGASLVMHLNSVATSPVVVVRQNGKPIFERPLDNKDGKYERNNEYNENITVSLQAGPTTLEIDNSGEDWYFLDWVRLDGALQATGETASSALVPLEHYVLSDGQSRLLWLVDSRFSWPRGRTKNATMVKDANITLKDWPNGEWNVEWWQTQKGGVIATSKATARNGQIELPIASFTGDIAARLTPAK